MDGLKNAGREAFCFPPCSSASSIVAPLNRTAALGVLCRIGGGYGVSCGVQIVENALRQHLVLGIKNVPAHTLNGDNLKSEVLHLLQMRARLLNIRVDVAEIIHDDYADAALPSVFQHTLHVMTPCTVAIQNIELQLVKLHLMRIGILLDRLAHRFQRFRGSTG